jgi:RNA polymerase sigma-70 factor (ECF subfamily)
MAVDMLIQYDLIQHGMLHGSLLAAFCAPYSSAKEEAGAGIGMNDAQASGGATAELLARCAVADKQAFQLLYQTHSARLYGVALRITRQPALASDAVHDALLQVWRNAARYDPERGNADGWLLSLVRYRALDIARRQAREMPGLEIPERADTDPDALERLMTTSDGIALRRCLDEVEPGRRRLIMMAFAEGLTQSEVAARVSQPLGTVKSSIRRALLALRACLERPVSPLGSGVAS